MNSQILTSKIRLIYIVSFVFAGLLLAFCLRWQLIDSGRFKTAAASRDTDSEIQALRGTIYAADGSTLAYSEPRYNVFIWVPELIYRENKGLQTHEEFFEKLAPHLDSTAEHLQDYVDGFYEQQVKWIEVAKAISLDERRAIEKDMRGMEGYFFRLTSKRVYPENQLAAQVLGLTTVHENGEVDGLGGLEGEWDGNLEPLSGFVSGERDARGNAIGIATERTIEAQRGNSIYTSIDKYLQQIVEENLEWAVDQYGAESGTVIIMDPKTGQILAMANYPTYDPNLREQENPDAYGNQAVSEPFEIGSVGKVFALAAAIDAGVVEPNSVIMNGHQGCEKIHDDLEPVCTHDKLPQPALPISEAFALSDNLYFYHLAEKMYEQDPEMLYNYLDRFGIGKPTGVDIAGESYGLLKPWEQWNVADIAAYSYGHSYQVNSLQGLSAVSAVANYGVRMQPYVVTKVVEASGKEISFSPIALEQVISEDSTKLMDEMMHVVYQNNIFWWEHHYNDLRDYKIAMKSGTALIPFRDRAGYSNDINATYVGYDASPDRTFAMLTRLERPAFGNLASSNSRVLWLETFRDIKDYLNVPRVGEF